MIINKGKQAVVSAAFKIKGIAVDFINPPVWSLINSNGQTLMTGVATPNGARWNATFTVSTNYLVPQGEEELTVEFNAVAANGREYTISKEITLEDLDDGFKPDLVLYSLITQEPLYDGFYYSSPEVVNVDYQIQTPFGTIVHNASHINSLEALQKTKHGYEFELDLGRPDLSTALLYNDPMQGILTYYDADDPSRVQTEIHSIYVVNARIAAHCNSLKQYLDKARLIEIDPSLQWYFPEFTHYLQEAMKVINATGVVATAWTIMNYPYALQQYVTYAAAVVALNARYLAEGFNHFDFQGLNTNLTFDRRDTIQYKIDELNNYISTGLAPLKNAQIRAGYPTGTAPPDVTTTGGGSISVLGLTASPVNNKVARSARRLNRFWG